MNFFQRRKILKRSNLLDLTPIRIHEHIEEEEGKLTLLVPKFRNKKLSNFIIRQGRPKFFRIHLDEFGSAAWLEMDGKKNMKTICDNLSEKFGDNIQPVEQRISKYLTTLYDQRYITFVELQNTNK
ncbi:PqqD family protein [candidate division KSB1 bacterium]